MKNIINSLVGKNKGNQMQATAPIGVLRPEPALIMRDCYHQNEFLQTHIEITTESITLEEQGVYTIFPLDGLYDYSDMQEEIRMHIARKISALAPILAETDKQYLLGYTVKILGVLAEDQTARVRRIIAEELKDSYHAPAEIIRKLAWDTEMDVAQPVLEYSPLLSDAELIDILSTAHLPWVSEAIAKRRHLSAPVSNAVILTENQLAIQNLLNNDSASLSEEGLDDIINLAPHHEHWHIPLVARHELTSNTINRIAEFVSHSIFRKLEEENRIPSKNLSELKLAVHRRLQDHGWDRKRSAEILAEDLFYRGRLDGERIMEAIEEKDDEFVYHALALLTDFTYDKIRKILSADNAKAVTALAWQAGLSMRDAIQIQLKIAHIHHASVLYAKDGIEYPLTAAQMQEYLDSFS